MGTLQGVRDGIIEGQGYRPSKARNHIGRPVIRSLETGRWLTALHLHGLLGDTRPWGGTTRRRKAFASGQDATARTVPSRIVGQSGASVLFLASRSTTAAVASERL